MIEFIKSNLLDKAGFHVHGFTKRIGGSSKGPFHSLNLAHDVGDSADALNENLNALRSHLGVDAPLVRVKQVHGSLVVDADDLATSGDTSWISRPELEADGIVGAQSTAMLAVQFADCVPVLLADPTTFAVAAIHAGWRGLKRQVLHNGVRKMIQKGCDRSNILAAIGPHICLKCYEVGADVARHFPESTDPVPGKPGKFKLDLGLAAEVSLLGCGLLGQNIEQLSACTSCLNDELFSHRAQSGESGRSLGFILAKGGAPSETKGDF